MLKNKTILVTGGAGFIGSNICDALISQNNKVVCLDNFITGKRENIQHLLKNGNFVLFEGDIRSFEDCQKAVIGVDVVLHQAALGSIPRSIKDPATTNAINVGGFINVILAARDEGIKRIVYASSSSVYGSSKELPKIEQNVGDPLSPYAISKKVNEMYASVFAEIYDLKLIGLRYFNVYGMRQDPQSIYAAVIPKFIDTLIKCEQPVINGDGSFSRDFTFVEDVVQVNLLAATTQNPDAINQVYNVAAGGRNTIITLFNYLKRFLSKYNNRISEITPIFGPIRSGDIPHSQASIEKAQRLLSYKPEFNFEKGLKKTVEWYIKNH